MKLHHAAALALAGWYLMIPRIYLDPGGNWIVGPWERRKGQIEQPELSSWELRGSYETAAKCHEAIVTLASQRPTDSEIAANPRAQRDPKGYNDIRNQAFKSARCVVSDDLRLRKNIK
jgi:hypothetical protein